MTATEVVRRLEAARQRDLAERGTVAGIKYDSGKPRFDLIVPGWMWQVAQVLTHGANKYGANNWQGVEPHRYVAAKGRHSAAYHGGETYDPETGLHHMAHDSASAMFLYYRDCGFAPSEQSCHCPHCHPKES